MVECKIKNYLFLITTNEKDGTGYVKAILAELYVEAVLNMESVHGKLNATLQNIPCEDHDTLTKYCRVKLKSLYSA